VRFARDARIADQNIKASISQQAGKCPECDVAAAIALLVPALVCRAAQGALVHRSGSGGAEPALRILALFRRAVEENLVAAVAGTGPGGVP